MLENLALRHQLQVALRRNPHPRLRTRDRVLWVWLRGVWPDGWHQQLRLARPETVLRWHRKGWRLYWTWKSRNRLGRPHLSSEVRELIARISRKIRAGAASASVANSSSSGSRSATAPSDAIGGRRSPSGDHQRWRTFLTNQLRGIWAADLFVVHTVTYRTLYVFFIIRHERREWLHFDVTASPTAAWIWRQVLEATPLGRQPKFLIHDRDADYGGHFEERLANLGIAGVRTPPRAPKANAIGERIVRTVRRECLDHLIVINEAHLQAILAEFAAYYNRDRPHRSLELQTPVPVSAQSAGRVISRPVLGGIHHVYARAA